jgi:maltose/moltooligosaccharide transporter
MLSRKQKLSLASASIGAGLVLSLNSNVIPLLLDPLAKSAFNTFSNFFIGIVIGITLFLGILIPPIIGTISDNTWTRFGRRIIYMIIFVPLTVVMLLIISIVGSHLAINMAALNTFILLAICITLLYTFLNLWNSTYCALLPDLTEPAERGETSGYMQAFNILGTILAFAAAAAVWETNHTLTFVIFAIVITISSFTTIITIEEKKSVTPREKQRLISIVKDFVKEKNFVKFMITSMFWWFAIGTLQPFFVLFAKNTLGLAESSALVFMGIFTVILVACAVPAGIFADKIGKKRILSIGVLISAIGLSIGAFTTEIILIYIAMGLAGLGFGVIIVLNFALTADLLPKGKEGKFMGLGNIFYAAPQMIAAPFVGFLISTFNNNYQIIFYVTPISLIIGFILLQRVRITN